MGFPEALLGLSYVDQLTWNHVMLLVSDLLTQVVEYDHESWRLRICPQKLARFSG